MIQANDGGANVSFDGGRTWSTQMNQPTAEIYGVWIDDQFPYKLYGAQQDNTHADHLERRPIPYTTATIGATARAARPGRSCRTRRDPDIVYGSCKGQYERDEPEDRAGASSTGSAAQSLYGNSGKDLILRFQRVSPMATSPHDPDILYYGSQYVHRTRDKGVTWEKISPDLTAFPPCCQGAERRADHARRHRRRVLQHALRDHRVAARDGRDLDRRERRPVPRHARQRQDVDERHAEGSARPAAACSGSTRRRTAAAPPTSPSIATCSATTRRTSTGPTTTARRGRA